MGLGIVLILTGAAVFIYGWLAWRRSRNAVIVTGKTVAMRREIYINGDKEEGLLFSLRDFQAYNENKETFSDLHALQEYDVESDRNVVFVYKPIVRFLYLGEAREAVVQEPSVCKPTLHVSMEIAFFPENPKIAWRPAKQALSADAKMFIGVGLIMAGVLYMFNLLPFISEEDIAVAVEAFWEYVWAFL